MKTVLVVSPHLDDAALSAGQFLAGRPDALIVTVFAGMPKAKRVQTTYDKLCGFETAEEAITKRRAEDRAAAAELGAKVEHLAFVDSQYGEPVDFGGVVACLRKLIEQHEPEFVVGPLGINHPDHALVRNAFLEATRNAVMPVWLYEDIPSRVTHPETVTEALYSVEIGSPPEMTHVEPGFIGTGPLEKKMSALWCYRSQLPLFPNHHELLVGERFWRVER